MVIKKGMNDSEIIPMATYCKENELELRFIEYMDVGSTNGWKMKDVITKKEIYAKLQESFELEPVEADYFGEVAKSINIRMQMCWSASLPPFPNRFALAVQERGSLQMANCIPVFLMGMAIIFVIFLEKEQMIQL